MQAFFEGGPLDGNENREIPDDSESFIVLEYGTPRLLPEAADPTAVLPVIEHHYLRVNHVGLAGRFIYAGAQER